MKVAVLYNETEGYYARGNCWRDSYETMDCIYTIRAAKAHKTRLKNRIGYESRGEGPIEAEIIEFKLVRI